MVGAEALEDDAERVGGQFTRGGAEPTTVWRESPAFRPK